MCKISLNGENKAKDLTFSQTIHNFFVCIFAIVFNLEVAKDYLRDQIDCFAWSWHVLTRRECETPTAKSLKMLTALLFQQVKNSLRARL
jgi:hypothetical protein